MKLTSTKIIITNLILALLLIAAKIWHYNYLSRFSEIFSNHGGGKVSADFINLYLHQYEDVIIVIPDFSIYIIGLGLIVNIIFLVFSLKKAK